jgi:hypothetical protein
MIIGSVDWIDGFKNQNRELNQTISIFIGYIIFHSNLV